MLEDDYKYIYLVEVVDILTVPYKIIEVVNAFDTSQQASKYIKKLKISPNKTNWRLMIAGILINSNQKPLCCDIKEDYYND
jgi:hypothetical protein